MRFSKSPKWIFPSISVFVPLAVLFASSLNGLSLHDALKASFSFFFSPGPGFIAWLQVLILNLAIHIYLKPIFAAHQLCQEICYEAVDSSKCALRRLNGLYPAIMTISVAVFIVGFLLRTALEHKIGAAQASVDYSLLHSGLGAMEACINGFFVGVILALDYEDKLFITRQSLIKLHPLEQFKYSSLYFKIFLVLAAIVLFMMLQTLFFAGSSFSLGGVLRPDVGEPRPPDDLLSGADFILKSQKFSVMRDSMKVFALRILILGFFALRMVGRLKWLIKRPLSTVLDRLKTLNSENPEKLSAIDIMQNDEFAAVYREINSLIRKKQSELDFSGLCLDSIVDSAADPILAFDGDRKIQLTNPALEAMFGLTRAELIGQPVQVLFGADTDAVLNVQEDGRSRWERRFADGRLRQLESHQSWGEVDNKRWTTMIIHDITRQTEFEANLRRAKTEAENASRLKSEFLANMSHELRTPLNAVLGFAQLLSDDRNLTDEQRSRIGIIGRSGEHLLALINDILDISKIEAGKMDIRETVFDLPSFINDLRDMFALKCRKKGLSLYVDTMEDLPRYVSGDLGKLRQVLINLLGNAVKFTAEGGVSLFAGRDGDKIRFSVRDTGRGIPAEDLPRLMRPFVQASTTDQEGGTGLGLAISSRYVAMLGGELAVESALGQGSVFSFALTLPESAAEPADAAADSGAIVVDPPRSLAALVVDDQAENRLVLREMLERVGFAVLEAGNGQEALERVRTDAVHLVFMDIKMPIMDGYAAAERLKADPLSAALPIFALTASAFSQDEDRILAAGFDGFLAKPFKLSALYALIRDKSGLPVKTVVSDGEASARTAADAAAFPIDFGAVAREVGADGLLRLAEAVAINDFASLRRLADELPPAALSFAAALKAAADAYRDDAAQELIAAANAAAADSGGVAAPAAAAGTAPEGVGDD